MTDRRDSRDRRIARLAAAMRALPLAEGGKRPSRPRPSAGSQPPGGGTMRRLSRSGGGREARAEGNAAARDELHDVSPACTAPRSMRSRRGAAPPSAQDPKRSGLAHQSRGAALREVAPIRRRASRQPSEALCGGSDRERPRVFRAADRQAARRAPSTGPRERKFLRS